MTGLSIITERHDGFVVVRLAGELDHGNRLPLVRALERLLGDTPRIVVDTSGLRFCDSHGLWTLIACQRRAEARGGGLRLIGVHGPLARLLIVTPAGRPVPTVRGALSGRSLAGSPLTRCSRPAVR
ncbi:STAS domain-containing protein [Nonomuraea sp. NN258]|uniref:STAS domain-containing protein n=1 Tax=Nonomuraea antri TaxID=2730852 RepID=UPI001568C93D|nr:STAS domain-containing protein [Nonomuraea antri]